MITEQKSRTKTEKAMYTIEFCHIYTDKEFSQAQVNSIKFLKDITKAWDFAYETVILFDNYNVGPDVISNDVFFEELKNHNILPDFWALEKDLIKYAPILLDAVVVPKIKRQYENYIANKQYYPCSFLTSIWYLLRLGYIKDTHSVMRSMNSESQFVPCERVINILANDFMDVERKVIKLINATQFKDASDRIQDLFYQTSGAAAGKTLA
ncbi:hypothetical protein E6P97_02635 [Patescibacteria group bacterium]|nr:MAG: hypothetical protein E6P97_02635 [Patescibacteria group bacterium]